MNKTVIFLFVLFLYTTNGFGQSVNAYYDAIALSKLSADSTNTEANEKVLLILSNYINKDKSFDITAMTKIYTAAVKNLFKLEPLFSFNYSQSSNSYTIILGKAVNEYKALKDKSGATDLRVKEFKNKFELLKIQVSDSITLADSAHHKRVIDSLADYLINYTELKKKPRQFIVDTATHIVQAATNAAQLLSNIIDQQNIIYEDSSQNISRQLSAKTTEIQNFFATNFNNLDDKLKSIFTKAKNNSEGERLSGLNKRVSSHSYAESSSFSDQLYQKNETATLTNFKLPSQTEVIDALAIFLAKRFKQEVALTLVDQFRKTLKNDRLLNDLFPETYKMFSSGQLFEMPSFGSAWSYAISKDFTNMLLNLSRSPVIIEKIGDTALVTHLQNVISLSTLINKQYSYVDAISQLHFQNSEGNFFGKNIRSLYIINKELFDTGKASQFWVNSERFYSLDEPQLNLFYALLKEKYNSNLGIINEKDLDSADMKPRIRNMFSSMLVLLNNFQASRRNSMTMAAGLNNVQVSGYWDFLMSLFETLQTQWQQAPSPYVQKLMNILNYSFETYSMLSERNYSGAALKMMDLLPEIRDNHYVDIEAICFSAGKLQKIVASSNYNTKYRPVQEGMDKLDKLVKAYLFDAELKKEVDTHPFDYRYLLNDQRVIALQKNSKVKWSEFKNNFKPNLIYLLDTNSSSLRKQIIAFSITLQKEINSKKLTAMEDIQIDYMADKIVNGTADKYISQSGSSQFESLRKVTGFLSDMVLAGNSKNLSQVISKYAMPPNSYKIKRNTRTSWDINAYVGGYLGAEMLTSGKSSVSGVYGFSAPVGVSHSWGKTISANGSEETVFHTRKGDRVLKGNSFTIDLSLIDIGAVVSYRLTNDASKGLPQQVKWTQIISPGLHFRWGIKGTSICYSAGIQNTPQLRKINDTSPPSSALRLYTGFFFDIPLINISYR